MDETGVRVVADTAGALAERGVPELGDAASRQADVDRHAAHVIAVLRDRPALARNAALVAGVR